MAYSVNDFVIEVTRKCNMSCDHCMRGDAQNMVMNPDYIEECFKHISRIGVINFSGGEPALHPEIIFKTIELAQKYNITIDSFYIATNGTIANDLFCNALFELFLFCKDNTFSRLDISNDYFHELEGQSKKAIKRLSAFAFCHNKFENDCYEYGGFKHILRQGRGADFDGCAHPEVYTIQIYDDEIDGLLYLNCEGDIVPGCDFSYDNQSSLSICDCHDFGEIYDFI